MADTYFVYVTAVSEDEALRFGRAVVEARLAACANVLSPMRSVYWWEGKLEESREAVLVLKTTSLLLGTLTDTVKRLHSYDCPCVVALLVVGGNADYLAWIKQEVTETV